MKTSAQRGSQACGWACVIGSFAVRREACSELRKGLVSRFTHLWPRRAAFSCVRGVPPVRTRRLTFLKAGRGHTTSSSSAITIAKMDQRSCSITYQPRNCVDVLPLSCASKKDLTKMEGWLVPYRTLALDLCPQSIGRAPRLPSAAGARLDPHDLSRLRMRSYTGTLPIKHAREHSYMCHSLAQLR